MHRVGWGAWQGQQRCEVTQCHSDIPAGHCVRDLTALNLSWFLPTLFSSIPIDSVRLNVLLTDAIPACLPCCSWLPWQVQNMAKEEICQIQHHKGGSEWETGEEVKPLGTGYLAQEVVQQLTKEHSFIAWGTEANASRKWRKLIMLALCCIRL